MPGREITFNAALPVSGDYPKYISMFPDEVAESITQCSKREGHLYIDGVGIEKIRIAEVQRMDALDEAIQEVMSR